MEPLFDQEDSATRCLFVVSHDIDADPSAAHLLRVALWDRRRGAEVCVFLTDEAICVEGPGGNLSRLTALNALGVRLLASAEVVAALNPETCGLNVICATDDDLASLLMDPTVRSVWY